LVNRLSAVYLRIGLTRCLTRAIAGTSQLLQPPKAVRFLRPSCSPRTATRRASRMRAAQATLVHLGLLRQPCPVLPLEQETFKTFSVLMRRVTLTRSRFPERRATFLRSQRHRNARLATNDGPSTSTTRRSSEPTAERANCLRSVATALHINPFHEADWLINRRTTGWLTFTPITPGPEQPRASSQTVLLQALSLAGRRLFPLSPLGEWGGRAETLGLQFLCRHPS
jgi:hypothetical protein